MSQLTSESSSGLSRPPSCGTLDLHVFQNSQLQSYEEGNVLHTPGLYLVSEGVVSLVVAGSKTKLTLPSWFLVPVLSGSILSLSLVAETPLQTSWISHESFSALPLSVKRIALQECLKSLAGLTMLHHLGSEPQASVGISTSSSGSSMVCVQKRVDSSRYQYSKSFSQMLMMAKFSNLFENVNNIPILADSPARFAIGSGPSKLNVHVFLSLSRIFFVLTFLGCPCTLQLHLACITSLDLTPNALILGITSPDGKITSILTLFSSKTSSRTLHSDLYGAISALQTKQEPYQEDIPLVPTSSLPLRLFLSSFHLNIFCFSQILSRSRVVKISAGETFFGPTRRDKYIYELLAGRCLSETIESAGQSPFSCQSGDVIGETSLITGLPPSYSVKTRGPCRLLQISKKLLLASGRSDDVSFQILAVIFEGTLIRACLFERALSKYLNSPPLTSPSSDFKLRAVGSGTFLEFSSASFQHTLTRSSTSSMVHSNLTMDVSRDESESSQCDSVSSDVQFRADETSVVEAQAFGFYRPRLLDWHRFTDEHLSYLLISGTSHEINILALLHPYMFPSPQVMFTKVLELSSTSSPKRFVRLVASILRFNWHYLQAVEIADQLKMLVHRAQSISVADDAPLKDAFALETAQTQLGHAHTFAQERLRNSASSLIAASPRRCSFEDMSPQQVALALSFLDSEQVSNIHPTELMRKRFTDRISAPRLHSTIDHFNEMTKWIMSMVINPTERSQRAWQITRWVQIGTALLVESNFSSLQIVMTALDHVNVTRLKATWELVPNDVQKEFQRLCQVVTPLKNFENYRTLLAQNIKSAIPIIPTITKDLFQIEEVHETFEKHRHLNMRKLHRIYEIMHNFICIQTSIREAYASRVPDPAYLRFLQQKDGLIDSADVLYELSVKREPNSIPAKKLAIREPPSNQSSNDVFHINPSPSRDASIRARFTRKGATVGRTASVNMSPGTLSDSGSHHILRIKILGTTPAFMNLGLHSVTKTLVLTSRQTDSVMVVSLLIEKLVSTMRPSQSQLFIKEALEYVLYEEKNGKTIPVPDKPLSTRPDLLLTFELDRAKPKMSPDAFKMLKLEYENAMLSEELQSAQDHIAKLELQLALLDPDPVDI